MSLRQPSLVPWEIQAKGHWGALEMRLSRANREMAYHMALNIASYVGSIEPDDAWMIGAVGCVLEDVAGPPIPKMTEPPE